jgi:hypothetical protein
MAAIPGTAVGAKLVPLDSLDTYPTHEDYYGQGGYVVVESAFATNITLDQILGGSSVIPAGRRKKGQIIYLPAINKHYTFTTTSSFITSYDIKPALPHEYDGSFLSTSFVAKTSTFGERNYISSYIGQQDGGGSTWEREMYLHSAILGGSNNTLYRDQFTFYLNSNINTTIIGGSGNFVNNSNFGLIGGGDRNQHVSSNHSTLLGGTQNKLTNAPWSLLGGGRGNVLGGQGGQQIYNVLGGGEENTLLGQHNVLGGGRQNLVRGSFNTILGGEINQSLGINDIVVGGRNNRTLGGTESGRLLFARRYSELTIDSNYVLDTRILFSGVLNNSPVGGQTFIESIPGASVNGQAAAGTVRLYEMTNTVASSLTGAKTLGASLSSQSPSPLGRFGKGIKIVYSGKNGNRYGLLIGEPGNNRIYFYSLTANNAFGTPTPLQTIDLNTIDPLANAQSLFGNSIAYVQNGYNENALGGSPFNMLFVGAPGNDAVYVFTSNNTDPVTDGPAPFTYVTKITGNTNSEFGYNLVANGNWAGTAPSLSSVFVCVGAPNAITPNGNTGDIYLHFCSLSPNHTRANKSFTQFSPGTPITTFIYNDNHKPGARIGESFASTITFVLNDITLETLQQSSANRAALSSYDAQVYFNCPNADINYIYRVDPENNNRLIEQTFTTNVNYVETIPGYSNTLVPSGGIYYGCRTNFNDLSTVNFNRWWGSFSMLGQGGAQPLIIQGPNKSASGVYSRESILNNTNINFYSNIAETGSIIFNRYNFRNISKTPRRFNNVISANHPGATSYLTPFAESEPVQLFLPYPSTNYGDIQNYGFQNFEILSTTTSPGLLNVYYLSGGILTNAIFANDLPGETTTASVIVGGNNNTIGARSSTILGGTNNNVGNGNSVGLIVAGNQNTLTDSTNDGISKLYNSVIQGSTNNVDGTQYSTILNGTNNKINRYADNSAILGGSFNTINRNISACYVLGLSLTGNKSNTVFIENLKAVGHIEAKTKSFTIKHPTKEGKTLTYGSLESPYHGVRLTGFDKIEKGICVVQLPDYICKLVKPEQVNIQITNYKHNKIIYVDNINIPNNTFTVKTNSLLGNFINYEFFWSFTAVRNDVSELQVES